MFSFRNRLSPTTSTMLKLSRSPCTITVHQWHTSPTGAAARIVQHALGLHSALAHDDAAARMREAAAIRLVIDLMQDAVHRLERDQLTIDAREGSGPPPTMRLPPPVVAANGGGQTATPLNGFANSAATLVLGVAGALIAAGALAPKDGSIKRLLSKT